LLKFSVGGGAELQVCGFAPAEALVTAPPPITYVTLITLVTGSSIDPRVPAESESLANRDVDLRR
jgi:hypothetical protein